MVFMTLKQRFADTWQATLNATHSEVEFDSKMMYVDAYVNKGRWYAGWAIQQLWTWL